MPPRVQTHDVTLRDGEQTPDVVFSVADKIAIAETLAAVGVDRIEAGMTVPLRSRPSLTVNMATVAAATASSGLHP